MKMDSLVEKIQFLVKPITDELNYELYHLEFVKEQGENYLRIYIDKPEGRISLTDCEAVSRRVSDMLDVEDPIPDSYYLEVSSPGLNRGLYNDNHYNRYIGHKVLIKLKSAINGTKTINGQLDSVNDENIIVCLEDDSKVEVPKDKIKTTNLDGEI